MSCSLADISALVNSFGLIIRGCKSIDNAPYRAMVLIGSAGGSAWTTIKQSPEYNDGKADPIDRWAMRTGTHIAKQLSAKAIFPFQGPPYHPFLTWAESVDEVYPSKLGMFIHRDYGLWHAYRFALLLLDIPNDMSIASEKPPSPCESCQGLPCLNSCPVNAFSFENGKANYDVATCVNHLHDSNADCHQQGCLARNACPVGINYRNPTELQQFHMQAFYQNQRNNQND